MLTEKMFLESVESATIDKIVIEYIREGRCNMKRMIRYSSTYNDKTELLEFEIEISYMNEAINSSTIMDLKDSRFYDFEAEVLAACEIHDFELEDSYQSNRVGSVSQYYIFTKTNAEGTKLRVFLKIRISDHEAPGREIDGKFATQNKLSTENLHKIAKEHAETHYNQHRGYRARLIDIVLNDEHFTSYESALQEIEDRLDEFDPESDYK